jgi:hypothetical protein
MRDGHIVPCAEQVREGRLAHRARPTDEQDPHVMEPPRDGGCTGGMTRILALLLVAGLVLVPAAAAKGPHAILDPSPEAATPGKPWEATIQLYEFRRAQRPVLTATKGDRHVTASVRRAPAAMDEARFEASAVFPSAGRWRLTMVSGKRSFSFPAISVGSGTVMQDYVAFPVGSEAARQGANGVYVKEEGPGPGEGTSLEPEVISLWDKDDDEAGGGTGLGVWLFPLLGVVIAGAGVAAVRRRR